MGKLIRVQNKGQVTIPVRLRSQAGIAEGDVVVATFQRGRIVLTPQFVIDRSTFPSAADEYTPAQRRGIAARLAESEKDLTRGRRFGPFDTAGEMVAHVKAQLKKRAAARNLKAAR